MHGYMQCVKQPATGMTAWSIFTLVTNIAERNYKMHLQVHYRAAKYC